uniref:Uncharacterized protein n=1 Tax=Arundo donax TaxID=35708 RepID=A0A0A9E9Y2_ARUDO
MSPATASARNG